MVAKLKFNRHTCIVDHSGTVPAQDIAALPESQAGAARHRCAMCSYQLGYERGIREAQRQRRLGGNIVLRPLAVVKAS